jgi:TetR/AcrR family transcriptional regulator, regulator of cefoperazone and chloramphenicol sensitivity
MGPALHLLQDPTEYTPPKIALIEAAERLFGERTIDSVSMREIAVAAGNGNNNAVQYHFGSKQGLIDAIFVHRVRQMDPSRRTMLKGMVRDNGLGDARRIAEAFCLPLLDVTDSTGRHTYAGFLAQYIVRYRPIGLRHAVDTATERTAAIRRLFTLVEQLCPNLPADLIQMRLGLAHLIFINMLVWSDHDGVATGDTETFRNRIEDALNLVAAAYRAPYR